jgi:hypothetical protein
MHSGVVAHLTGMLLFAERPETTRTSAEEHFA